MGLALFDENYFLCQLFSVKDRLSLVKVLLVIVCKKRYQGMSQLE
jgi:hypothetical protein